jgi:hypothetical protein
MSVDVLLSSLADRSVELFLDGDRLRYRAPAGALTMELRGGIAAQRLAIIEHLRVRTAVTADASRCTKCDRRNWRDDPLQDGRIRTTCGKCGRFIGYRPVEPRMA